VSPVVGAFSSITTSPLPNHLAFAFFYGYKTFSARVSLLGDANLDNKVDLSDLSTVLNNFGQPSLSWTDGNFDYAPTIDLTDLSDVLNHFGQTLTSPTLDPSLTPPTPTPEPTSLALFTLTVPLLLKRRR
jgi:hypothetical protein